MIFDSKEFCELRREYQHIPAFLVPENIKIARNHLLQGELKSIEDTLSVVPKDTMAIWKSRLLGTDRGNFIGVWFEIWLYRWLLENNIPTQISPIVDKDKPDFKIFLGQQEIFIEAKAFQTRHYEYQINHIYLQSLIGRIRKPLIIDIEDYSTRIINNPQLIYEKVKHWLRNDPTSIFHYTDGSGTNLLFKINHNFKVQESHVLTSFSNQFIVEPNKNQKKSIIDKLEQHQYITTNNLPYLLAVYLEDEEEDLQDILNILIGKTTITININTGENINTTIDKSGIISSNEENHAVCWCGALVFEAK